MGQEPIVTANDHAKQTCVGGRRTVNLTDSLIMAIVTSPIPNQHGGIMNPEDRKHVLRMIDHGLFIVGAGQGADAVANGVTWLTQASFSPPLIMAALRIDGRLHEMVEQTGAFSVNIVSSEQQEMVQAFFNPAEVKGERMNGYFFEPGPATGSPLFPDTPAWFEVRVRDTVKGGDHTVFVAEVIEAGVRDADASALNLSDTSWQYGG